MLLLTSALLIYSVLGSDFASSTVLFFSSSSSFSSSFFFFLFFFYFFLFLFSSFFSFSRSFPSLFSRQVALPASVSKIYVVVTYL